jgi:hypothetical protein
VVRLTNSFETLDIAAFSINCDQQLLDNETSRNMRTSREQLEIFNGFPETCSVRKFKRMHMYTNRLLSQMKVAKPINKSLVWDVCLTGLNVELSVL